MNEKQLCADIFTILRSGSSDDDIQQTLIELLGFDAVDFIIELITNRTTIVHNIIRMSDYDQIKNKPTQATANQSEARRPVYGTQFIVQSEKELKEEKRLRKEQKRAMKSQNRTEGKWLRYLLGL